MYAGKGWENRALCDVTTVGQEWTNVHNYAPRKTGKDGFLWLPIAAEHWKSEFWTARRSLNSSVTFDLLLSDECLPPYLYDLV